MHPATQTYAMCLCWPVSSARKRPERSSDSEDYSIIVNYESSSLASSSTFLFSSCSSLGYLDPYDFASSRPSRRDRSPVTSASGPDDDDNLAMINDDNFSTAAFQDWVSARSDGSHQEFAHSLGSTEFSSASSPSCQQLTSSDSHDPSAHCVDGESDSIPTRDSGYDAFHDTNSVVSQESFASAVHGSVSEASSVLTKKAPNQPLRMQTSNSAAEYFRLCLTLLDMLRGSPANMHDDAVQECTMQRRKQTPQPANPAAASLPTSAIGPRIIVSVGMADGGARTSTREENVQPTCHPPNVIPEMYINEEGNSPDQVAAVNGADKPYTYSIGVLSSFEETHLSHEDKQAVIEGGCHGLCGSSVTTHVNSDNHGNHGEDNESHKSSPCVRGPFEKPARFISTMSSTTMPDGRRGPTSSLPRFSRRRCAGEYRQPRQPLSLVQRWSRKTATQSDYPRIDEFGFDSCKPGERKLARKQGFANLREQMSR